MNPLTDLTDPLMSAPRRSTPPVPPAALSPGSGNVHARHRNRAAVRRGESADPPSGAGSGQETSWSLPQSPSSVPRARRLAGGQLAFWGFGEHREIAELLVSELVTNALRHGAGSIRLGLRARNGLLRFEVEDADGKIPRVRRPSDGDEGGRGLRLVSMLSSGWGSARTPTGKVVWFELLAPSPTGPPIPRDEGGA